MVPVSTHNVMTSELIIADYISVRRWVDGSSVSDSKLWDESGIAQTSRYGMANLVRPC